jgi:uncharacterized membrane protein YfcA
MPEPDLVTHLLAALAACLISFLSATAGLTGAFLLVPFQISVLGLGSPSVSATNHLYNVVAAPGGFSGYRKQRRMVWPLAWAMILGTVPGVLAGIVLRLRYLPDPAAFKVFAGAVLGLLGVVLFYRLRPWARRNDPPPTGGPVEPLTGDWIHARYRHGDAEYSANLPLLALFSALVGVAGGAYGVGGGIFTSAFLIGVYRLPVHTTAGATLISTWVASIAGTLGFALLARSGLGSALNASPLWTLGLAMGIGGMLGGRLGARAQRRLPSTLIGTGLAFFLLLLGAAYVTGLR